MITAHPDAAVAILLDDDGAALDLAEHALRLLGPGATVDVAAIGDGAPDALHGHPRQLRVVSVDAAGTSPLLRLSVR